ncbi:lipid-binding SYLF domain-containing protein [Occallatibacter riparius]|uniref:Lipid-binding SYLF domain-containing protein n=1 Tax=Occallatibacter riparius TaxID=1002689 RepID=A0A9J7BQK3_9BACT|nr:lipid-binding SYLF domain-containing protein [Occallatibacter riparius]UWZ84026.1 lipid-binding SYLF domain-containing protein [Occallatibacter riparius]
MLKFYLANATRPRRIALGVFAAAITLCAVPRMQAADKQSDEETLQKANLVLSGMLAGDTIPADVLARTKCVVVVPGMKKFGVGIGGSGGRGPMLCREGDDFKGKWSTPAMMTIGGASIGVQLGGSSTDLVLLVMEKKVVNQILSGKTKMGTDATAAAGPSGATAGGAADADVYSYGRAKGMFAGVSISGATVSPDNDANNRLYTDNPDASSIVRGTSVKPTPAGQKLVTLLDNKTAAKAKSSAGKPK